MCVKYCCTVPGVCVKQIVTLTRKATLNYRVTDGGIDNLGQENTCVVYNSGYQSSPGKGDQFSLINYQTKKEKYGQNSEFFIKYFS